MRVGTFGQVETSPVWAVPRGTEGVRIMVEAGVAAGMSVPACLSGTGLTEDDLSDENAEIWAHQEFGVMRNLIERLGDRPGLGVTIGRHSTLGRTGVIGFMMLAGPTLADAVRRALPYLALSPTHLRFGIASDDDHGYISADDSELPAELRPFIVERDLSGLAAALRGAQIDPAATRLETSLDAERARLLAREWQIPDDAVFADRDHHRLVLPKTSLMLRLPQADEHTARVFEQQCRELLDDRRARVGAAGQVRSRLHHDLEDWPTMDTVAAELHVDPRTLRRALTREGTSFRALTEEVRRSRARDLLAADVPVAEVARRLGYAETSTFTRTFKRWEGVPPSRFRQVER